jgi:hypothetical protein
MINEVKKMLKFEQGQWIARDNDEGCHNVNG